MTDLGIAIRKGCCEDWPKPCSYHEGWLDGWEMLEINLDLWPHSTPMDRIRESYAKSL